MKIISLFGGPGTGKSTTAAGLFALMKHEGCKVELVLEYAKEMTYERRDNVLSDQLYMLAKQNRRLERLKDHGLDWAITDSPLLLGLVYAHPLYLRGTNFREFILQLYDTYDNINIFLKRIKSYSEIGRNQSEEEAKAFDVIIKDTLNINAIYYEEVVADRDAAARIYLNYVT